MITGKKILITGGAGFIGSTLATHLAGANEIVLFDNLFRNTLQYTGLESRPNVRLVKGDVLDFSLLKQAMDGADVVIHCAAIAGIDTVIKDAVRTMEVDIIGSSNALKAARELGVKGRVLLFSTSEVFGSMAYHVSENAPTIAGSAGEARWVYAVSKLAGEHLANAYFRQYGVPIVTVRPFNVYGPGQTGEGALAIFVQRALQNQDIHIHGEGTQIRAWCYVDDMVQGALLALERPEAIGGVFNIGNSKAVTTIYGLAQTVCRVLGSDSRILFRDRLSADIELRIPDTKKSTELLGFTAKVGLEEGIQKTGEWFRYRFQSRQA